MPYVRWSRLAALSALVCAASRSAAQTVSGRIADSAGTPIAHVRVVAHPMGDSTELATRIAFTNAQGDFVLGLAERRPYVIRVRRIGFAPEPDQIVDLTRLADAMLSVTLHGIALSLAPVQVSAAGPRPRCLDIDDPAQNPRVRQWLDHALFLLQTRRIAERDLLFKVQITQTRVPMQPGETTNAPYSYTHQPGARSNQWMEDDASNLAGILREVAAGRGGDFMPTETTLLSPTFRSSYCFENILAPGENGTWVMRLRELHPPPRQPLISGSLTFAADGLAIDAGEFRASSGNTALSTAFLGFTHVTIEGESFPIVNTRGVAHLPGKGDEHESRVAQAFVYSVFTQRP